MKPHGEIANTYTAEWFSVFLDQISEGQTAHEVRFLRQFLPSESFSAVIDLCCGTGRHVRALARLDYRVTGIDRDRAALATARQFAVPPVTYLELDMRQLHQLHVSVDAVVCLWQSFGYFDDATNRGIVQQINRLLRPRGRFILDIYNRDFFVRHPGSRIFEHRGTQVSEAKHISNKRMQVTISYVNSPTTDRFDWRLYTLGEISELASEQGFKRLVHCSNFDAEQPVIPRAPRMQLVFEKCS